jgi:hypothetical protein
MRIGEAKEFMKKSILKKKSVLLLGAPGVGKTFLKMQAAEEIGYRYLGICAPLCDVSFIAGYPYLKDGVANFAPFGQLADALNTEEPMLLDIDEIGSAQESVAKAMLRMWQFREVGNRKLPDHVVLSASSNDVHHGVGVFGFNEALKDRFQTIITVEPHLDDTVAYGLNAGWPTCLLAFLRNTPDALHDWKPSKNMQCSGATPRGWEDVAHWINDGFDDPEVISGKVGKGRATEYLAFRDLMNDLPDVDAILMDPDNAPVPTNPSARHLVSMALASKMSAGTMGQCIKYLHRLPQMFRALSIRDAFRAEMDRKKAGKLPKDHKPLYTSRDFVAWSSSADGKEIMTEAGK